MIHKDITKPILERLYARLNRDVKVLSIVPDDLTDPYLYLGPINYAEDSCKAEYRYIGFITLIYYTGYVIDGSLIDHYKAIDLILSLLKDSSNDTLNLNGYDLDMTSWYLDNNSGLEIVDNVKRLYATTLQYGFEVLQLQ